MVTGASGATGRLLVRQLLERGWRVRAVVRSAERLPVELREHVDLTVVKASLLDLRDNELVQQVEGCSAVASCLGHNITVRGIWGRPRRLVADATRRLCEAIRRCRPEGPAGAVRFVLMNTAGNRNHDLHEPVSPAHAGVLALLRLLAPPHADNEDAAAYLSRQVGQGDPVIEWAAVRPDSLTNDAEVTPYEVHSSPVRSALFDPGKTSRVNVAHFMADLISRDDVWAQWRGRMPVIYNASPSEPRND